MQRGEMINGEAIENVHEGEYVTIPTTQYTALVGLVNALERSVFVDYELHEARRQLGRLQKPGEGGDAEPFGSTGRPALGFEPRTILARSARG